MAIKRIGVAKRWSDVVINNHVAYFVEVADDPTAEPVDQFRQVLSQVETRLTEIGSDKAKLIQVIIYLPDRTQISAFNELWDNWLIAGHAPSRACIIAELVDPAYQVELVITAAID